MLCRTKSNREKKKGIILEKELLIQLVGTMTQPKIAKNNILGQSMKQALNYLLE